MTHKRNTIEQCNEKTKIITTILTHGLGFCDSFDTRMDVTLHISCVRVHLCRFILSSLSSSHVFSFPFAILVRRDYQHTVRIVPAVIVKTCSSQDLTLQRGGTSECGSRVVIKFVSLPRSEINFWIEIENSKKKKDSQIRSEKVSVWLSRTPSYVVHSLG